MGASATLGVRLIVRLTPPARLVGIMGSACRTSIVVSLVVAYAAAGQIPPDPQASNPAAPATASARTLPAPFITRQTDLDIPFSVKAGTSPEAQPTSVRVFVSWDRGKTWHFYDERKPEDARFKFKPRQDGEFWFATQTIDRSGRPDSPEPRQPQLCLIIDTQRPQLLVQAALDGSGNVQLSWSAADANLAAASLKLEYQDAAGTGGPWQPIEFQAATTPIAQLSGQTTFRPNVASRSINLRAEIADAAGSVAYFSQKLSLTPPKPKNESLAAAPAADPSATRWTVENPHVPLPPQTQLAADASAPQAPAQGDEVAIPGLVENPHVGPGRLASNSNGAEKLPAPAVVENPLTSAARLPAASALSAANVPSPEPSYDVLPMQPAAPDTNEPPLNSGPPAVPHNTYSPPPPAAYSPAAPAETMPPPQPTESLEPTTAQRPRLTNSRRFSLDYDVHAVGPEGVSAVELWGTSDGGRTWGKWGGDPDKTSPFDVEVNHEAVYGFRIVVVGKNGLATATPQAGEAADIWVGIDLTPPTAKLTGAQYGQGEAAGKLDIRWEASDANLGSRPIGLAIADRPSGPFTPIAAGLPNSGQFFWEYDPRSPRQIYLRLEARDEAGNVGIDQLNEPIRVEGLEPKGQIRGFSPR